MTPQEAYHFILLTLCIWREARGEDLAAKRAVAWCIRNRVTDPGWWGRSWADVVLKPYQFSSFNQGDPNATKFPGPDDAAWLNSITAAHDAFYGKGDDPTKGATHYYDDSIAKNPPAWASKMVPTLKVGKLNFYKERV